MMRVFLGLDLPDSVRSALAVQQFLLPLPRRVPVELFHLTLVFVAKADEAALEAAHDGWSALRPGPFQLCLSGLGLFGGDRPHAAWAGVAPSDALSRLQARADRVARAAGLDADHRRFPPHVTLGRFRPPDFATGAALERAVAAGSGFAAGPWDVHDMVLWQSHRSDRGPRYEELARYPLS